MVDIRVSLVYALRDKQHIEDRAVPRGTSVGELLQQSTLVSELKEFSGVPLESLSTGIYAEKVTLDRLLQEGDRVEIYRPLQADPKEVRRQLAILGKTIGSR